jgi:diguanylate cyclase (GGDEF)-like protein
MSDVAKRLEKADKYIQKGKLEDALQELLVIVEREPENAGVRERAADLCISLNRPRDAIALLAVLFDQQAATGDQPKAIITYKKLARLGSPQLEQSLRYAQFLEKTNKKEALEIFQEVARQLLNGGQRHDAVNAYKRIVALEPTLENIRRLGDLAEELRDGRTAAMAFFEYGQLEQKAGKNSHAWYERAYAMDASNADAALAYAHSLLVKQDAATALRVIEPIAKRKESTANQRFVYARALLGQKRPKEADPMVWALYAKDSTRAEDVALLAGAYIDTGDHAKALATARRLEEHETKVGRKREVVGLLKAATHHRSANVDFLEYMRGLYNATNHEQEYCEALVKLFDLYYGAGNYVKAGESLDAAVEVDPYSPAHQKRLEMLKGKVDTVRIRGIGARLTGAIKGAGSPMEERQKPAAAADGEPTELEDLMLQAEIFLQYSMRSKAVERLERINKLFPRAEAQNEKLRALYAASGYAPKYAPGSAPPPPAAKAPAPAKSAAAPAAKPAAGESDVDNIARVTEITRNIYRQANVKSVLFAAVNDVGRHWNASRCVAGLCSPGKPPSAALEYCAPGIKQSEVMAIVKLIQTLQAIAVNAGVASIPDVNKAPELASIKQWVESLSLNAVLAVPLLDGEEHVGVLILEQCGASRQWRQTDVLVLKTIADQMVLAVNNARLRSLMKNLAVTDEKSGLLKRASYLDVLLSEVKRAMEQKSPVTVLLLHFGKASALVKEIGEAGVETMMQQIGQICSSHVRQNDLAVRYELTTIALVLADTNEKSAFFVVDKLRKVLSAVKVPGKDRTAAMDAGIAECVMQPSFDPIDIVSEVINRAESALALARLEGGNKAQSLAPQAESAGAVA